MDTLFNFQAGVSNRIQNNVLWIPLFCLLNFDCVSKSAYPKKWCVSKKTYPNVFNRIQTYANQRIQNSKRIHKNASKSIQSYSKKLPERKMDKTICDLTSLFLHCTCWVQQTNVQFLHVFIPLPTLIFLFEKSLLPSSLH